MSAVTIEDNVSSIMEIFKSQQNLTNVIAGANTQIDKLNDITNEVNANKPEDLSAYNKQALTVLHRIKDEIQLAISIIEARR